VKKTYRLFGLTIFAVETAEPIQLSPIYPITEQEINKLKDDINALKIQAGILQAKKDI
jgi:hypothetical protein